MPCGTRKRRRPHPTIQLLILLQFAVHIFGQTPRFQQPDIIFQASNGTPVIYTTFSPDSTLVATVDIGGVVLIWDLRSGRICRRIEVAATRGDNTALPFGNYVTTMNGHPSSILFGPREEWIAIANLTGSVQVISPMPDTVPIILPRSNGMVYLTLNASGTLLGGVGRNGMTIIWRVGDWRIMNSFSMPAIPDSQLTAISFDMSRVVGSSGRQIAFKGSDQLISVRSGGRLLRTYDFSSNPVRERNFILQPGNSSRSPRPEEEPDSRALIADLNADGTHFAAAAFLSTDVFVYSTSPFKHEAIFSVRQSGAVSALGMSKDGTVLGIGYQEGLIEFRDVRSKRLISRFKTGSFVSSVRFSPDDSIVVGETDGVISLWKYMRQSNSISFIRALTSQILAADAEEAGLIKLADANRYKYECAFSSDGKALFAKTGESRFRAWDLASGKALKVMRTAVAWDQSQLTLRPSVFFLDSVGSGDNRTEWLFFGDKALFPQRKSNVGGTSKTEKEGNTGVIAVSPTGLIAAGQSDGTLIVREWGSVSILRFSSGVREEITAVSIDHRGDIFVGGLYGRIWCVTAGERQVKVIREGMLEMISAKYRTPQVGQPIDIDQLRLGSELDRAKRDACIYSITPLRGDVLLVVTLSRKLVKTDLRRDTDETIELPLRLRAQAVFSDPVRDRVFVAADDGRIFDLNVTSKVLSNTGISNVANGKAALTFSTDGRWIAFLSTSGALLVYDALTLKPVAVLISNSTSSRADAGPHVRIVHVGRLHRERDSGMELDKNQEAYRRSTRIDSSLGLRWATMTPECTFDADSLDSSPSLAWVFADDPFRALAPEVFMRDCYEPRLLPRLLDCNKASERESGACAKEFPKVRPLGDLNRVQPGIKISSVKRDAQRDLAEVTVEVSPAEGQFQREGATFKKTTAVYDLRLFRAGQLVGQEPEPKAELEESLKNGVDLTPEQLQDWRDARRVKPLEGRVKLDTKTGKLTRTFVVRLPHGQPGKEIEFTAYAFNEDRVKSETAKATYRVPADLGSVRKRAYVIAMGVNAYENQRWDLHFAANDAKRIQEALSKRLSGYEVVPVTMISDCRTEECPENGDRNIGEDHATKAALHAVLQKLAGHALSEELKKSLPPGAEKVEKAEPDDLVLMFVSSHGYTSKEGTFYMVPSDSGDTEGHTVKSELLQQWVSSDELSGWLRDVDAGDLVMIVDTCHSASTVEEPGFKPGPMGSRGLGQLAYDKGMRILAASQADDVALEVEKLKQGLLTYALVENGLEDGQAAGTEGKITMDGWLQYGVDRVPTLYNEVLAGKVQKFTAHSKDTNIDEELSGGTSSLKKPSAFQQPSLFNFQKQSADIVLGK